MNQSCIQRREKVAAAAVPRVLIFHSCANFCFCFHAVFILFCLFCAIFVIFVKTHFWDLNINVRIFFVDNLKNCQFKKR